MKKTKEICWALFLMIIGPFVGAFFGAITVTLAAIDDLIETIKEVTE